jgi:hypothetical protein
MLRKPSLPTESIAKGARLQINNQLAGYEMFLPVCLAAREIYPARRVGASGSILLGIVWFRVDEALYTQSPDPVGEFGWGVTEGIVRLGFAVDELVGK